MKRFWGLLLSAVLVFGMIPHVSAISASCAVVMDADSGRVLYEQNAHQPRLIASITKLMTALTALESGHGLKEEVEILPEWTGAEGSSLYLKAGEVVPLETLLYGMLLRSGNDAALAVAGYCGGTVENFVGLMNQKAEKFGMVNTHFANPNGLNAEGHYSSAYDMALLAKACMENETLAKMVSTKTITLGTRTFTNHNKLLWRCPGCIGLKTGYTEKAGRTLVSAAERDGTKLICVTLNAPDDWRDHMELYDRFFASHPSRVLTETGENVCQLPISGSLSPVCTIVAQQTVTAALQANETPDAQIQLNYTELTAPVKAGTVVGKLIWTLNGQELSRTNLIISQDMSCVLPPRRGLLGWLHTRTETTS